MFLCRSEPDAGDVAAGCDGMDAWRPGEVVAASVTVRRRKAVGTQVRREPMAAAA